MVKTIWEEVVSTSSWLTGLLVMAMLVLPVVFGTNISDTYALYGPTDFYTLIMEGLALPLIFPLLAVALYVAPFSTQLSNRYLVYTRTRADIRRTLVSKACANATLTFVVFFLTGFMPFVWAYLLEPALGLITYNTEALDPAASAQNLTTFSQLLAYGPWAYGLGFSVWLGLNGALYATIGFLLLFFIPNRFVAMSVPFLAVNIVGFVMAVLQVPQFAPGSVIPFNLIQFPIWVPFVPFAVLAAMAAAAALYVHRNTHRLDVLQ
jgi:hypothetical protein